MAEEEKPKKYGLLKPSCNIATVTDGRGGIFTWLPKEAIKEFNMLYFTPGASRGNHMHPGFTEYFLVVEGSGAMVMKDPDTGEEKVFHMSKGDCSFASPGVAHAFHAVTNVTSIAMLSNPWDECNPPIIHEKVTDRRTMKKSIALFGAKGFVGSEIAKSLKKVGHEVIEITRENFEEHLGKKYDYVINSAMPAARYKAKINPEWDYQETVEKTRRIFNETKFDKFIQISSVSARCQLNTTYGKNKLAAEEIVNNENSLIVRLGPMYGNTLKKGVLIDMLENSKVYVGEESRYSFAPVEFVADWIAKNLDRKGIWEVGGKNSIYLKNLVKELGLNISFEGETDIQNIETISPDYPDSNLVKDFIKSRMKTKNFEKENRIKTCRFCGNKNIISCIDIGEQYLSSIFPENLDYKDKLEKQSLEIVQCVKTSENECGCLQLAHNYDLSDMYEHYPYTSSSNSSMKKILENVANSGKYLNILESGDTILDIGSNDGTLLKFFERYNLNLVGIDPAQNIECQVNSDKFVHVKDFFSAENFRKVSKNKAKLVFAIAMFYHLHDPIKFCKEVEEIMHDDGVFIIQMAYLPAMIKTNMYDNIVHEHVGYYSTQTIKWVLEKAGLEIFDVELNDVYGGSFKIFAKKKGNPNFSKTRRLQETLEEELKWGIFKTSTYSDFMNRINFEKQKLINLLEKIKKEGKRTWIYGASTKGNTIMQFCGIGKELIEAAADSNSFKFGKYMIGTNIPIFDENKLRQEKPNYLLALPYSFVDAFKEREKELVNSGTQFIIPLPEVKIV